MKIVGFIDKSTVLAEVSTKDLAGMVGLVGAHKLSEKLDSGLSYNSFEPNIVGTEIKPSSIFEDASAALNAHKEAKAAAKQLKAASSRFLGFFKEEK